MTESARESLEQPSGSRRKIAGVVAAFLGAPTIWALHLMFSYLVVSLGCAQRLAAPHAWVIVLTVLALLLTIGNWWVARSRRASGVGQVLTGATSREGGEEAGKGKFFAVTGALLTVVFGVGILFTALPLLFLPACG